MHSTHVEVYTGARQEYTVEACVCQISDKLSRFHFAISALKASCSLALSVSGTVVPFCSSCYLKNFTHSVGEALHDPVLQHSLRFDFDMNLYGCAGVCVRVCLRARVCNWDLPWRGYIISGQRLCCLASWLIHPFPLDRPSLYSPTSNSLACYHDKTHFTTTEPSLSPCPNSHTYPQKANSPLHCIPCDWFYQSLTKSQKISYLIQLYCRKIVCVCVRLCVWGLVCTYINHVVRGKGLGLACSGYGETLNSQKRSST